MTRAHDIYGYENFICDSGGSICEVCDPFDPKDTLMNELSQSQLLIWIKGSTAHSDELIKRFDRAPKPMCYQPAFLLRIWQDYQNQKGQSPNEIDPDTFVRFSYSQALAHRQPRYEAMANWGVTVSAQNVAKIKNTDDFNSLIAKAIAEKSKNALCR